MSNLNKSNINKKNYHHYVLYWLFAFLLIFIIWSNLFYLDQFVRAEGIIMPSSRVHKIQSIDAGIIEDVYVEEGQFVKQGEKILQLKKNRISSEVNEITSKISSNDIVIARLNAEISGSEFVYLGEMVFSDFFNDQYALYSQRLLAKNNMLDVANQKLNLARDQFSMFKELSNSGDISLIELQSAHEKLLAAQNEIINIKNDFLVRSMDELSQVRRENLVLNEQYNQLLNKYSDTTIYSPIEGIVNVIHTKTKGLVVTSGEHLLDISPVEDDIFIELKINPIDVGSLYEGLPVSVSINSFDFPIYGTLEGHLIHLSSDLINEVNASGKEIQYYNAFVYLNLNQNNTRIPIENLKLGMGVTANILTGKRTVFEYISKPILRSFSSALGEK